MKRKPFKWQPLFLQFLLLLLRLKSEA